MEVSAKGDSCPQASELQTPTEKLALKRQERPTHQDNQQMSPVRLTLHDPGLCSAGQVEMDRGEEERGVQ